MVTFDTGCDSPSLTPHSKEEAAEFQKTSVTDKTKIRSTLVTELKKLKLMKLNRALNLGGKNLKFLHTHIQKIGHEGIYFAESVLHQRPQITHKHLTRGWFPW